MDIPLCLTALLFYLKAQDQETAAYLSQEQGPGYILLSWMWSFYAITENEKCGALNTEGLSCMQAFVKAKMRLFTAICFKEDIA